MASSASPGPGLLALWRRLGPWPGGRWLFSRLLAWRVPYTGSIGARIDRLEPGDVRVVLRDRRAVRNHLRSVHAVALVNLAEVASGLALLTSLPPGVRGIVTSLRIDYLKKARGTLVAESRVRVPPLDQERQVHVTSDITDVAGEAVARATVTWRLGPEGPRPPAGRA